MTFHNVHYFIHGSHLFRIRWFICIRCRCSRGCCRRCWNWSLFNCKCSYWDTVRWFWWKYGWHSICIGVVCKVHWTHVHCIPFDRMSIVFFNCCHPFGTEIIIFWKSIQQTWTWQMKLLSIYLLIECVLLLKNWIGRLSWWTALNATTNIMQYGKIHWRCGWL